MWFHPRKSTFEVSIKHKEGSFTFARFDFQHTYVVFFPLFLILPCIAIIRFADTACSQDVKYLLDNIVRRTKGLEDWLVSSLL